jgi:predicted phage terminase large subunit-like protein
MHLAPRPETYQPRTAARDPFPTGKIRGPRSVGNWRQNPIGCRQQTAARWCLDPPPDVGQALPVGPRPAHVEPLKPHRIFPTRPAIRCPRPAVFCRVPSHIGSKTVHYQSFSEKRGKRPPRRASQARAMFLTNIYQLFQMKLNYLILAVIIAYVSRETFTKRVTGAPMPESNSPLLEEKKLKLELRLAQLRKNELCRDDFLSFVKTVWPDFIAGRHHRIIAEKLERVARGELKRLIINMAPRHTKSEFASFLFPAWMMGRNSKMKIIQATHTTELAVNFGRKTKNLIESDEYKEIFPDVKLAIDSKASGRWDTNKGGMYYAVGVGSNLAGRGGDLVIIDDPHSEQTAMSNTGFDDAWDWYTGGPRQRLQPGGSIVLVQTRWSEKDMTGQLLRAMAKDPIADQWEVVELPAIFEDGTPCWPEYWSLEDLNAVRASIPPSKWNAQYQQNPTGEENAIIKREWWRVWTKEKVPQLQYVIQSLDTAFSKRETSDFSAITTWGVFYPNEGGSGPNLILLDSKKGRWDFPELKQVALDLYKFWEPDTIIIEAKASGLPLTQELRNMGIPVVNFTPSRGNDKISRVHSVSPLFEAGMVWVPDETWADELVEEVAAFPNGEFDDLVDSMTQALMRYRQGNFVQLPTDDWREEENSAKVHAYY